MDNTYRATGADGKPLEPGRIVLDGCLFGVYGEDPATGAVSPCFLEIAGNDVLAVFSTEAKLEACYQFAGIAPAKVKAIMDGLDFLDSLPPDVTVVLDPWITERGTTRFTMIERPTP